MTDFLVTALALVGLIATLPAAAWCLYHAARWGQNAIEESAVALAVTAWYLSWWFQRRESKFIRTVNQRLWMERALKVLREREERLRGEDSADEAETEGAVVAGYSGDESR
jgi:hypothetical protein